MADRRSLRKQNQLKNKPKPIVSRDPQGGIIERDPNTGKEVARTEDGGQFQAKKLFNTSVQKGAEVQLSKSAKTADYKLREEPAKPSPRRRSRNLPPLPDPEIEPITGPEDDGGGGPDNPNFGKCGACGEFLDQRLNCLSEKGRITFTDNNSHEFKTPALVEYGVKVTFDYLTGGSGELYSSGCADAEQGDSTPTERQIEGIGGEVYGRLIYSRLAKSLSMSGITGSNLKSFDVFKDGCTVTVVGETIEGDRSVLGVTTCDNLTGTYEVLDPATIIFLGDEEAYGVDPESIVYQCAIRVYHLCFPYRLQWQALSNGRTYKIENCDRFSYRITSEPQTRPFRPGAGLGEGWTLRYDSGIPRVFTVTGSEGSGDSNGKAYFQIYQNNATPCEYAIVGVEVILPATINVVADLPTQITKNYETIYTGPCGFEITLGDPLAEDFLQVIDRNGVTILETPDFIPGSVVGVDQATEESKLLVYEKTVTATDGEDLAIKALECIS